MRGDTMRRHEMSTLVGGAASAADPELLNPGGPPGGPKIHQNFIDFLIDFWMLILCILGAIWARFLEPFGALLANNFALIFEVRFLMIF